MHTDAVAIRLEFGQCWRTGMTFSCCCCSCRYCCGCCLLVDWFVLSVSLISFTPFAFVFVVRLSRSACLPVCLSVESRSNIGFYPSQLFLNFQCKGSSVSKEKEKKFKHQTPAQLRPVGLAHAAAASRKRRLELLGLYHIRCFTYMPFGCKTGGIPGKPPQGRNCSVQFPAHQCSLSLKLI